VADSPEELTVAVQDLARANPGFAKVHILAKSPGGPRLMKKADGSKGEKGVWKLYSEGLDNDGDGRMNEDGEGYVDPNRNWGFDWAPPYVQGGSGEYPFSGVGLKALAEWTMTKTNIAFAWSFHNNGGKLTKTVKPE
jgi:hypothetical protein